MREIKGLEIVSFTSNWEAAQFVNEKAPHIVGYIQDLNRDISLHSYISAGVRFLDEVISPFTPWARTVVISGYADLDDVGTILTSAKYEARFIPKRKFDRRNFRRRVRWLLEVQVGNRDNTYREVKSEETLLLKVLEPPWDEVCRYIAKHPAFLHSMDPRMFEKLVAEIFRRYG